MILSRPALARQHHGVYDLLLRLHHVLHRFILEVSFYALLPFCLNSQFALLPLQLTGRRVGRILFFLQELQQFPGSVEDLCVRHVTSPIGIFHCPKAIHITMAS